MKTKKDMSVKVIRVTKTEFELDTGDIYPLPFEFDHVPSLKEFNEIYANSRTLVENLISESKSQTFEHNGINE